MFDGSPMGQVRQQLAELRQVVTGLEPDDVALPDAPALWVAFDQIERLASGAKLLLARKVDDSGIWQQAGDRSAAHWMARQAGGSITGAQAQMATSKRLTDLPETSSALRRADLSVAQAALIADAASHDPKAEDRLVGLAGEASLGELREECGRVKAAADPDPERRHRRIRANRRLRRGTGSDGAWWLAGRGPVDDGGELNAVLDPIIDEIFREARAEGRQESREAYAWDAVVEMARRAHDWTYGDALDPEPADAPNDSAGDDGPSGGERHHDEQAASSAQARSTGHESSQDNLTATLTEDRDMVGGGTPDSPNGVVNVTAPDQPGRAAHARADSSRQGRSPTPIGVRRSRNDGPLDDLGHDTSDGQRRVGDSADAGGQVGGQSLFGDDAAHGERRDPGKPRRSGKRRAPNERYLSLLRVDLTALTRGRVDEGEMCEISGVGTVPASVARELLGESILKLVLTDGVDVRAVVHLGRGPTVAQKIALLWQSPQCRVLGCCRTDIEFDHRIDWTATHHTVLDELDPLCRFHHALKTRKGWALVPGTGKRRMVPPGHPDHPGPAVATNHDVGRRREAA